MMKIATKTHSARQRDDPSPRENRTHDADEDRYEEVPQIGKRVKLLSPVSSIRCLEAIQDKLIEMTDLIKRVDFQGISQILSAAEDAKSIRPKQPFLDKQILEVHETSKFDYSQFTPKPSLFASSGHFKPSSSSHKRESEKPRVILPLPKEERSKDKLAEKIEKVLDADLNRFTEQDLMVRPQIHQIYRSFDEMYDCPPTRNRRDGSRNASYSQQARRPQERRQSGRTSKRNPRVPPPPSPPEIGEVWTPPRNSSRNILPHQLYETHPRRYGTSRLPGDVYGSGSSRRTGPQDAYRHYRGAGRSKDSISKSGGGPEYEGVRPDGSLIPLVRSLARRDEDQLPEAYEYQANRSRKATIRKPLKPRFVMEKEQSENKEEMGVEVLPLPKLEDDEEPQDDQHSENRGRHSPSPQRSGQQTRNRPSPPLRSKAVAEH